MLSVFMLLFEETSADQCSLSSCWERQHATCGAFGVHVLFRDLIRVLAVVWVVGGGGGELF